VRRDGRAADQLRTVRLVPNFTENPLGSILSEIGRTRVLCTVNEEPGVPRFLQGSDRGWLTAEYSMLPGSTDRRTDREVTRGRASGRTLEIQRLIGRSLRAVADLSALGERTLWIDCDVLQADGGTRCAAITGAYTALALALRRLLRRGDLERNPLRDSVAAVSAGIIGGNVVATGKGRFVEIQGTGEEATFSGEDLAALTALALRAVAELTQLQLRAIAEGDPEP
jgi:ribonuclease PH